MSTALPPPRWQETDLLLWSQKAVAQQVWTALQAQSALLPSLFTANLFLHYDYASRLGSLLGGGSAGQVYVDLADPTGQTVIKEIFVKNANDYTNALLEVVASYAFPRTTETIQTEAQFVLPLQGALLPSELTATPELFTPLRLHMPRALCDARASQLLKFFEEQKWDLYFREIGRAHV